MPENLIQETKNLFTNNVVEQISKKLEESPAAISKALSGIIPSLFAGFIHQTSMPEKAKEINDLIHNAGERSNQELAAFFSTGEGQPFVRGLFEKIGGSGLTNVIADFASIKTESAAELQQITLPIVMGFLGRFFTANDIATASEALQKQKIFLEKEMPTGVNLAVITGADSLMKTESTKAKNQNKNSQAEVSDDNNGGGLSWFFVVFFLALIGVAALYFSRPKKVKLSEPNSLTASDSNLVKPDSLLLAEELSSAPGKIDNAGNFIYDDGPIKTFDLNGVSFQAGAKTTEIAISEFLLTMDTTNTQGKWFTLKNVQFETDSNTITKASLEHLVNIAKIVKAFPGIKFHISAFTDSSGNKEKDLLATKVRASRLASKLKELGIPDSTIRSAKGYGFVFPISGNKTAETNAKNRRISLYIIPK